MIRTSAHVCGVAAGKRNLSRINVVLIKVKVMQLKAFGDFNFFRSRPTKLSFPRRETPSARRSTLPALSRCPLRDLEIGRMRESFAITLNRPFEPRKIRRARRKQGTPRKISCEKRFLGGRRSESQINKKAIFQWFNYAFLVRGSEDSNALPAKMKN